MRTEQELRALVRRIEQDTRMTEPAGTRKPANVQINAPLALQQCAMEGAYSALRWALGERENDGLGLE